MGLLPRSHQNFQSVAPIGTISNINGFQLLKTVLFLCALQIRMQRRRQFQSDFTVSELIAKQLLTYKIQPNNFFFGTEHTTD